MDAVTLCECFARDGLQHEPAFVPTETKRALVERFAALGLRHFLPKPYTAEQPSGGVGRAARDDVKAAIDRFRDLFVSAVEAVLTPALSLVA